MNLLVVGSCTKDKDKQDCPFELTERDLDDSVLLRRREAELARCSKFLERRAATLITLVRDVLTSATKKAFYGWSSQATVISITVALTRHCWNMQTLLQPI